MQPDRQLRYKIASDGAELEAIHRLNYETFVEEIPQHPGNAERRLVDKFHAENTYAICLDGDELVGMICARGRRPFSLDAKLPDLDSYLPAGRRLVEVRLLAVRKAYRSSAVFTRLAAMLARELLVEGYDLALISGTTRQLKLYGHIGFVPFGSLVGTAEAPYQPMYLSLETVAHASRYLPESQARVSNHLCGPVEVRREVREAFQREPVSHRSARFVSDFEATRALLCTLARARHVELLLGSGTLANDAIAAQLSLLRTPGLILSNGEFGERLIDHGRRLRLTFDIVSAPWGAPLDLQRVHSLLSGRRLGWLWAVHCETSTGVLNDAVALQALCRSHSVELCLDCVSSLGTVPVDLAGVFLASCASGKGLGSYPGLSMVFHDRALAPQPQALPRYLDLGFYAQCPGGPFTSSTNLVYALNASLAATCWDDKLARIDAAARRLRERLRVGNVRVLADAAYASPAVLTIEAPSGLESSVVARRMRQQGFMVAHESAYLRERNWLQVAFMGEWDDARLEELADALERLLRKDSSQAMLTAA